MGAFRYAERLRALFVVRQAGDLRAHMAREASGTFAVRVAGTGLMFMVSLVLARILGAEGFGVYAYVFSWAAILQVPAQLGANQLLAREVSVYRTQGAWDRMVGIRRWATRSVLALGLIVGATAAFVAWIITDAESVVAVAFLAGTALVPLRSLSTVQQGMLRGLGKPTYGILPLQVVAPGLLLVLIGVLHLTGARILDPVGAVALMVVSTASAFVVGTLLVRRTMPTESRAASPAREPGRWLKAALPFVLIGGTMIIQKRTDIVMLGALAGPEPAGIYTAATRGAELVSFVLSAVNAPLGPVAASLYAQGALERLQRVVTRSARMVLAGTVPIALVLAVGAPWFLALFGPEFPAGRWALVLLCLGQLVNAGMGSVALLLNMSGHEKVTAWGVGFSAMLNVALNALLIPRWGIEGAAVATFTSTVVWNLLLAVWVRRRLGLDSTALGLRRTRGWGSR